MLGRSWKGSPQMPGCVPARRTRGVWSGLWATRGAGRRRQVMVNALGLVQWFGDHICPSKLPPQVVT